MDAFEEIVAGIYQQLGYWTRIGYKINLTLAQRQELGTPTMPRPEIDILAYSPGKSELLWIECKSYLDSAGVLYRSFRQEGEEFTSHHNRFKIFNDSNYRKVCESALVEQLIGEGSISTQLPVQFVLVAGNTVLNDQADIEKHFVKHGWQFKDSDWLKKEIYSFAHMDYENNIAVMVAKLLMRNPQ